MFDGLFNSIKGTFSTSKRATDEITKMAKELPHMPWRKLKFTQWLYIIVAVIIFIFIAVVILPLLN